MTLDAMDWPVPRMRPAPVIWLRGRVIVTFPCSLAGGACPWTECASPGSLDERAVMSNVVRLRDLRGRAVSDMREAAANYERVEGSTSVRCVSEWVISTLSRQSSSADRAAAFEDSTAGADRNGSLR